ncbi:cell division protein ftsj [Xylogone sp. PMI_703]|nr:cell division protein ftsj [Xylogone sp. PMI_703]
MTPHTILQILPRSRSYDRFFRSLANFGRPELVIASLNSRISTAFRSQGARSSSSSTRWKSRQVNDSFAREARVRGLKSRAAFKLLEIDKKYKLFKRGQTVVDLGYAPGSWSQVAVERTKPYGRVIGIDIIPAQPPKGASTIQGNFLSPAVQEEVKRFLLDPNRGRPKPQLITSDNPEVPGSVNVLLDQESYIDHERHLDDIGREPHDGAFGDAKTQNEEKMVDVVLSDMSAPWEQTTGFWKRSLSDPYIRMMNTSGINFKDHAGSMDLCAAALRFSYDTLRIGGHFVCKFYQGAEDKQLETQLKKLFSTVYREKPESSRNESKEAYFVSIRRKRDVSWAEIVG